MAEHFLNIKSFLGIDNTSDLASVSVPRKGGGLYFYEIDNVDIDDNWKPHRREGFTGAVLTGTNIRSLWANEKICLFADGTDFKRLDEDDVPITLISGVDPTDSFCYVDHGDLVYFSNNTIVGYVDTKTLLPYPFPGPAKTFKIKMVGGHILEWYNNRLYAANGSNLFFSDSTVLTRMDSRKNAIAFPSRITMVKAVDDGLYVSDSNYVYFEKGGDATDFMEIKKVDVPAIEGMSASSYLEGKTGVKAVFWMTESGPYAGYSTGVVKQMQEGSFAIEGLESGTAIIKNGTYQQLLAVGRFKVGAGGSGGTFKLPVPTQTLT